MTVDSGQPLPQRRSSDTRSQILEWSALIIAVLGWAAAFMLDMATHEHFGDILTPKFLGVHGSQLATGIVAVLAAKRIE